MPLEIVRTPLATEDVLDIWQYVASDSVRSADALVERFETVFQALSSSPDIGVGRPDLLDRLRPSLQGAF